jgi:glycosyltransferase involved in cell wall biosynthesis
VHNWVDLDRLQPGPRENAWRRKHSLGGLFVVSFAGTMGFAQGLEYVIEAAKTLRDREGIVFVLAGDGVLRPAIEESVSREALHNVRLFPTQPEDEYVQLLLASDACLVTLHKDLATPVVPGKLQSIMAAGRPAICMVNPASDARKIVEEAGCGYFLPAGAPGGLAEAVVSLSNDRALAERMGESGRRYAEAHFGRTESTERYADLLATLGGPPSATGGRR